ncbi:MAG: hypothetical protein J6B54_00390 [Clostridia bacterium]|nr:hypothetical protein [Clostridia bacterium]
MIHYVWEHNENDTLLYAIEYPGAYSRGRTQQEALAKLKEEIERYCSWSNEPLPEDFSFLLKQEKASELSICDADSDVIFEEELLPLSPQEYERLKVKVLYSADCFQQLYQSIEEKDFSEINPRKTFYGEIPRTAREMYEHTKNVNRYYFNEIGVSADNEGTITECRLRGFQALESIPDFLTLPAVTGSYGELWSLRKVMRRFLWHDRIHGKAMCRMCIKTFPDKKFSNTFRFSLKQLS